MRATDGRAICPQCGSLDTLEHLNGQLECIACGHIFAEDQPYFPDGGAAMLAEEEFADPHHDPDEALDTFEADTDRDLDDDLDGGW